MGIKTVQASANLTPKQLVRLSKDNAMAQSALTKRSEALARTIGSANDKLMLLDSSVNGGAGEKSFQKAVDWFYNTTPSAGADPTAWSPEERIQNEAAILGRYAATRKVAAPVADTRAKRNSALSNLSSDSNPNGLASQRPPRNCPDCS